MTSYADNLRADVNSWSAAYIQFETGRQREGFRAYAFVEDDDDKLFYQLALTQYDNICYLGCGGRSGVFSIFCKLKNEGKSEDNLFFIDRDTERPPFSYANEVLRTAGYSWESHICDPKFVGWILQRKLHPNLTTAEKDDVVAGWTNTIRTFERVLDTHAAYCRTGFVLGTTVGIGEVRFTKDVIVNGTHLEPGPDAMGWHEIVMNNSLSAGAKAEEIERRKEYYSRCDTASNCHGKALFQLLRKFVEITMSRLRREFLGQYNSARYWIESMPWNESFLGYIREYTATRIGQA